LSRLVKGDALVFYSPQTTFERGERLLAFTAIGYIVDDEPYQVAKPAFHPWRRRMKFSKSIQAPIAPLIPELGFIVDKKRWGYPFRRGLFEVTRRDFERIACAMGQRGPRRGAGTGGRHA
jgi:hypothetical protein